LKDFDPIAEDFHGFILRCDSLGAVRRVFEMLRLKANHASFLLVFKEIVPVLHNNPIDRIFSLKWVLLFWRAEDSEHFNANCPESWKIALNKLA
jgi:hypothetical protein